jgi:outer membrane cobalamin receptor
MVDFTHIIEDAKSFNRTFVRISPSYIFDYKKVELEAGFKFAIMLDSLGDDPFFYPNIKASYFLVPEKVKAFAEVGGDYKKTSLRDLSYLNPFIDTIHDFVNTSNSIKLEAGLKGTFKKRFDYLLKFNLSSDNSLPLFVSDTSTLRKFNVVYDDVLTTGFHAGLGMRIDEKLFMQFATTLYNYSTQVEAQAWQLPAFDIDVNVRYTFAKKLDVRIQLYAIGERFQQDKSEANTTVTLNPFIDVNLHADYRYKENISFFLNVNNISNARYQRWYNYPSFGINALAGITFSL